MLSRRVSAKVMRRANSHCCRLLHTTRTPLLLDRKVKTLEDLNRVESLEDVDPELIKQLIEERTQELNTQKELNMLKQFASEEKSIRKTSLRSFTRAAWVVFLMSSSVYMGWQWLWWCKQYDSKEEVLALQVQELEEELERTLKEREENQSNKSWYRRWF